MLGYYHKIWKHDAFFFSSTAIITQSTWIATIFTMRYNVIKQHPPDPPGKSYNRIWYIRTNAKSAVWNCLTSQEMTPACTGASWTGLSWKVSNWKCKVRVLFLQHSNYIDWSSHQLNPLINLFWLVTHLYCFIMNRCVFLEPGKYESDPPKVLSIHPENFTLPQNSRLIIQCNASSTTPLRIWWLKQTDKQDKSAIKYFDKYYYPINNSDRFYVQAETHVYLSKLNVYNARETDSGVYACAAVSNSGLDFKMAVVKVISINGPWYSEWEPHTSFLLLFLIPIVLALIPVTVWLCYYRKKKKCLRKHSEGHQQERKLIRPVLNNNEILWLDLKLIVGLW